MADKLHTIDILVEFETAPIRRIVVKCPHCNIYFYFSDIFIRDIRDDVDLINFVDALLLGQERFKCPKCGYVIDVNDSLTVKIKETCDFPKVC